VVAVGRHIPSSVVLYAGYYVASCRPFASVVNQMNKGRGASQTEPLEDEEGFQKVVKRSNRIVRNVPNNAGGPRGRGGKNTGPGRLVERASFSYEWV